MLIWHSKFLPEDNLCIDFSHSARLPLLLDHGIIPVTPLFGVVWVVVYHDDHFWLQLVPLIHRSGARANILTEQLNDSILWVAVMAKKIPYQFTGLHTYEMLYFYFSRSILVFKNMPLPYIVSVKSEIEPL